MFTFNAAMMGIYRDNPITEKISEDMEDDTLVCGISSMQGWRVRQEDAHFSILDFDDNASLFGVFDGHGGSEVAKLAVEQLPGMIKNQAYNVGDYVNGLKNAYLSFDAYLRTKPGLKRLKILFRQENSANGGDGDDDDDEDDVKTTCGYLSGCTAVVALLVDKKKLYVANVGDSRCVVAVHGNRAVDMSIDHKPSNEPELSRIHAAGSKVSFNGRINRDLNLSRAFGDHMYKQNTELPMTEQVVIALPDVQARLLNAEYGDFIMLGCDGIWESLSSQSTVDFLSSLVNQPGVRLSSVCEELLSKCFSPNHLSRGLDNMTCIIVKFKSKQQQSVQNDANQIACKLNTLNLH